MLASRSCSITIVNAALPTMPSTHGSPPSIIIGRCQKIRIEAAKTQATRRPCRRIRIGAANKVQPLSSPMPTNTSMVTKVTSTCGQSASWAAVGIGAPHHSWLASTIRSCNVNGASTASAYQLGFARQFLSWRPQLRSCSRPWQETTTSVASSGPRGKFSAPEPPVRNMRM